MNRHLLAGFALAAGLSACAVRSVDGAEFDHSTWDQLLRTHVDDQGRVAYRNLQERDLQTLRRYLDSLSTAVPDSWPRDEQLAFWINAYNAALVWAVLQGQSAESLLGRARLFKTWKVGIAGRARSPDEIEHKILRQRFADPRIHFAIVCASGSCPRLRQEAYVASRLDVQLDDQARGFIADRTRNIIDPRTERLEISAIFDWFHEDFERAAGSVPAYLARYVSGADTRDWLLAGPRNVLHLDYDWALNAQPGQRPLRRR
jgi:hypothetical protein